jgi:hypothetical protein
MPFQKDSPYLDLFKYVFSELKETGGIDQITRKYGPRPQVCPDYSGHPLGFDSCIILFLMIFAGLLAGLCLILMEHLLHYWRPDITWFSSVPPEQDHESENRMLKLKIIHLEQHNSWLIIRYRQDNFQS